MIGTGKWSDLFAKHDFFFRYRYYLQIIASSDSAARQLKWFALSMYKSPFYYIYLKNYKSIIIY
jgi:poly(A) polymerase Pap1